MSHYIETWILPPGLNLLLFLIGFFIYFFFSRIGKWIMLVGVLSLWILSMPIVAYSLINVLQDQYLPLNDNDLLSPQQPEAILVLGGGATIKPEYNNKYTLTDSTEERVMYGAYLYNKTHLPIILSGGKELPSFPSEAKLMADNLQDRYHISSLFLEEQSFNTADESKYMKLLLKKHQIKSVYLVTNAWHMPRSAYLFHCAGIEVTPAPMGYFVYGPGYSFISFLPNINALSSTSIAIHEFASLAWYYFRYNDKCIG